MKRAAQALSLAMAFLFSIAVYTVLVASVVANPHPPPTPVIAVQSRTAFVNVHDVQLVVSAKVPSYGSSGGFEGIKWLNYSFRWTTRNSINAGIPRRNQNGNNRDN
jgi:hypothetical protein